MICDFVWWFMILFHSRIYSFMQSRTLPLSSSDFGLRTSDFLLLLPRILPHLRRFEIEMKNRVKCQNVGGR